MFNAHTHTFQSAMLPLVIQFHFFKVDEVRQYLRQPCVEDGELEPGATFWCHFCRKNQNKHVTDVQVSVYYGGVFEHFAR